MTAYADTPQGEPGVARGRAGVLRAGLVAGLAVALARGKAPAAASKRTKRLKTKRCKKQVQQCIDSLTTACNGEPACLEKRLCCDLLADCNAAAAVPCIFANAN